MGTATSASQICQQLLESPGANPSLHATLALGLTEHFKFFPTTRINPEFHLTPKGKYLWLG